MPSGSSGYDFMDDKLDEHEALISGFIDGEMDAEEQARLEALCAESPAFKRELDAMQQLASGTHALFHLEDPPDEVWDTFLDNVYNRAERKTGWVVFIIGALLLSAYGLYLFIMEPWSSALTKLLIATPIVGLAILFISVLRNRMETIKTDRYTREVHR